MRLRSSLLLALCAGCPAAVLNFNPVPSGQASQQTLSYLIDVDGTEVEVRLTAVAPFSQWTTRSSSGLNSIGYNDGSGRWPTWIDSRSGVAEGVDISFLVAGAPATVDLGPGGLRAVVRTGWVVDAVAYQTNAGAQDDTDMTALSDASAVSNIALGCGTEHAYGLISIDINAVNAGEANLVLNALAISHESVQLSWEAGPGMTTGYTLVRSADGSFGPPGAREADDVEVYQGTSLSYVDQNLSPNTTYHYKVEAAD